MMLFWGCFLPDWLLWGRWNFGWELLEGSWWPQIPWKVLGCEAGTEPRPLRWHRCCHIPCAEVSGSNSNQTPNPRRRLPHAWRFPVSAGLFPLVLGWIWCFFGPWRGLEHPNTVPRSGWICLPSLGAAGFLGSLSTPPWGPGDPSYPPQHDSVFIPLLAAPREHDSHKSQSSMIQDGSSSAVRWEHWIGGK